VPTELSIIIIIVDVSSHMLSAGVLFSSPAGAMAADHWPQAQGRCPHARMDGHGHGRETTPPEAVASRPIDPLHDRHDPSSAHNSPNRRADRARSGHFKRSFAGLDATLGPRASAMTNKVRAGDTAAQATGRRPQRLDRRPPRPSSCSPTGSASKEDTAAITRTH
jgi:hypothetical protein